MTIDAEQIACHAFAMKTYAPEILEFLSHQSGYCEIVLAPGTVAMQRTDTGFAPIGTTILSADDVWNTLASLTTQTRGGKITLAKDGVFSFGIPNRGRFRVSYVTQRGSYVINIMKVPSEIPELSELSSQPEEAMKALAFLRAHRTGLLLISSAHPLLANTLVYALLQSLVATENRLIFSIEPAITYLLPHGKSIVLQCEIGADVETLAEGVRHALTMMPDLLYVRNPTTREDVNAVMQAVGAQVMTIVSIAAAEADPQTTRDFSVLSSAQQIGAWRVEKDEAHRLRIAF